MVATSTRGTSRAPPRGRSEQLAYVFFHRPRPDVPPEEYDRALIEFHRQISRKRPRGFLTSAAFRLPRAPWAERRVRPVYVDWYTIENFAALDPIRAVAYGPPWVESHRAVAVRAADGWGTLYSAPRPARVPGADFAVSWFAAEARGSGRWGDPAPGSDTPGSLWQRQLALGPSPEFCWVLRPGDPSSRTRGMHVIPPEFLFPQPSEAGSRRRGA